MDRLVYYLNVKEFADSFIQIPTAPVCIGALSTTNGSTYLAGIADLYDPDNNDKKVGRCSASFLCLNSGHIYTDISNYISVDNGLIVSWFTPTTLINLAFDTIIHGMVTECIVVASTKIGENPYYGKTFNLKVSPQTSSQGAHQIKFEFTSIAE